MGGWDIYCAFCGASFQTYGAFDLMGGAYNPDLINAQELKWLDRVQVIGFNPNSFTVDKCYITGEGEAEDYGYVSCEKGDDPNIPGGRFNPGRFEMATYSSSDPDEPFCVPFHPPCFHVFAQALRYQLSGEMHGTVDKSIVNKDILFTVMSSLHEEYDHCLKLDYAELNEAAHEQYWLCIPGQEAWVSNPYQNEKVSEYFDTVKENRTITVAQTVPTSVKSQLPMPTLPGSPFIKFADEIVLEILLHLSYQDTQSFVLSGITPINLPQAQGYWKRKILIDLPFLWDLSELDGPRDFFKTYRELRRQCFATTPPTGEDDKGNTRVEGPRDKTLVLGLANRRRVWNTCSQLAELYVKPQKNQMPGSKESQSTSEEITKNSLSLQMPLVASPVSKEFRPLSTYFISSWEDMNKEHTFTFHFNDDGRLCGLEVEMAGTNSSKLLGEKTKIPDLGASSKFVIPAGNWITGFELNIGNCYTLNKDAKIGITGLMIYFQNGDKKQVGDGKGGKRRMVASDSMVVTGAVAELVDGVFQRLGLLQCSQTPTSAQSLCIPQMEKCMWRDALPPSGLAASTYQSGYWMPVRSFDTIPMEALVFGSSDEELSHITGFSSDSEKQTFAVHYENGSSKRIGKEHPSEGETMFNIDGRGGERITKVEVGMNSLPMAIKITTNRGRHCVFGANQKNSSTSYEPGHGVFVAGIYVSWGILSAGKPRCTTISIFSGNESGEATEVLGVSNNTPWSPPRPQNAGITYAYDNIAVAVEHDCNASCRDHW